MDNYDEFYKVFHKIKILNGKILSEKLYLGFKEDYLFAPWISKVWLFEDYPKR